MTERSSWLTGVFAVAAAIACTQSPAPSAPSPKASTVRVGGMISEDPAVSVPIRSLESKTLGLQTWRLATIPLDEDGRFDPRSPTAAAVVCVDDANAWTSNECVTIGRLRLTRSDAREADGSFVVTALAPTRDAEPLRPVEIVCRAPAKKVGGHMWCASADRDVGPLLASAKPQRGHSLMDRVKSVVSATGAHEPEIVAPQAIVLVPTARGDSSTKPNEGGELAISYSHRGGDQYWARTFRLRMPATDIVDASFISNKELRIRFRERAQSPVSQVTVELVPNTIAVRVQETRPDNEVDTSSERHAKRTANGKLTP